MKILKKKKKIINHRFNLILESISSPGSGEGAGRLPLRFASDVSIGGGVERAPHEGEGRGGSRSQIHGSTCQRALRILPAWKVGAGCGWRRLITAACCGQRRARDLQLRSPPIILTGNWKISGQKAAPWFLFPFFSFLFFLSPSPLLFLWCHRGTRCAEWSRGDLHPPDPQGTASTIAVSQCLVRDRPLLFVFVASEFWTLKQEARYMDLIIIYIIYGKMGCLIWKGTLYNWSVR